MNQLYYISGYHFERNEHWRFAVTVPHREEARDAELKVLEHYPELRSFKVIYLCETPNTFFKEL